MDVTQPTDDEQTKHWNTTAGCAWVDAQHLLDQMMKGLEDLLVDGVAAGSGRRVLDVGCGTGGTTLAVARRLGAEGQCVGADVSEPMIAAARGQPLRMRRRACRWCYVCAVTAPSDLGGRTEFFGPVVREPNEPVFHTRWEGRVFGMALFVVTVLGRNIDAFRFAMERLPRQVYLSGYYPRWLAAVESQLICAGLLDPGEVDARVAGRASLGAARRISGMRLMATSRMMSFLLRPQFPRWFAAHALPRLVGTSRPTLRGPRFATGDRVRVGDHRRAGHTRRPGYVAGKPGVVVAHLGSTTFPDAHAVGRFARPQHLYTVSFETGDLWGDGAEPAAEIRVDLYEAYLEPV